MDIYYLMDFTATMRKVKTIMQSAAESIANKIKYLTKDYKIGFGSFNEKQEVPYSLDIENVQNEKVCSQHYIHSGGSYVCYPANHCLQSQIFPQKPNYAFQHHMELTRNIPELKTDLNKIGICTHMIGNIDHPEAALEGMAQAMLCPTVVGWRNHTTKVIIVISDDQQHYAMDGVMGGLFDNFNVNSDCKTNGTGHYDKNEELKLDYPSFGQVLKFFYNCL